MTWPCEILQSFIVFQRIEIISNSFPFVYFPKHLFFQLFYVFCTVHKTNVFKNLHLTFTHSIQKYQIIFRVRDYKNDKKMVKLLLMMFVRFHRISSSLLCSSAEHIYAHQCAIESCYINIVKCCRYFVKILLKR